MAIGDDGRFFPQPLDLDLDRLDPPPKKKKNSSRKPTRSASPTTPRAPTRARPSLRRTSSAGWTGEGFLSLFFLFLLVDADQRFSPLPLSRALFLVFSLPFRLSLSLPPKPKCESQTGI